MEVARARGPLVLLGAHLAGVNAAFSQELAVSHSEGLANGLSNELGLWWMGSVSLGVSCPLPPRPPNPDKLRAQPSRPTRDKIPRRQPGQLSGK